ncbi:hypothetical protein [Nocardioides panzhihuensis]|uniref:Uncharacterized protein n=1 Tax=Nocardioides panzhihuensis TaxID=860243 RepID=A0A7Z0DNT9_9ACTN|nr:hypothetical protein [Nocardioides panzhihuensis]NYI78902.1 hypothetical protein [Nocardioides panzhihuensis]
MRMLAQAAGFRRRARRLLATESGPAWGQFLTDGGFTDDVVNQFAVPLVSCVIDEVGGRRQAFAVGGDLVSYSLPRRPG